MTNATTKIDDNLEEEPCNGLKDVIDEYKTQVNTVKEWNRWWAHLGKCICATSCHQILHTGLLK